MSLTFLSWNSLFGRDPTVNRRSWDRKDKSRIPLSSPLKDIRLFSRTRSDLNVEDVGSKLRVQPCFVRRHDYRSTQEILRRVTTDSDYLWTRSKEEPSKFKVRVSVRNVLMRLLTLQSHLSSGTLFVSWCHSSDEPVRVVWYDTTPYSGLLLPIDSSFSRRFKNEEKTEIHPEESQ